MPAQPRTITESSATIDVAAAVSPAVVRITTGANVDTSNGIIPETGVGSGVIYDAAGWILTNRHVVEGSNSLAVELNDGRVLDGTVYGIDTLTDLAIVKVEGTGLPTASLGDSSALKVGQLVIAIGSPLGTYTNSVTSGIVSAKGRSIIADGNDNLNNLIQTDAAINPGNSGGPLLDAGGNVVGINTAIAADSNGIGFAIPIDIARPIMEQAVAGEKLARPYMGIVYRALDPQYSEANDLPVSDGAVIIPGNGPDGADAGGRPGQPGGSGRPAPGRHHRQGRRAVDRQRPPARCHAERVRAGRHDLRRAPARWPGADRVTDPRRAPRPLALGPPAPPDLDGGVVERAAQLDRRLADAHADLGHLEFGQDLVADRLGDGLEQAVRRGLHDLAHDGVHPAVVDRLLEVVVDTRRLKVQHELDIDLEWLRRW